MLAALAGVTRTIRLGTMVLVLPLRNPAYFAKEWATLDLLSGGRTILGVGRRLARGRVRAHGRAAPRARAARMDEMLEAVTALWAGDDVTYEGKYYRFEQPDHRSQARAEAAPADLDRRRHPALREGLRPDGAQHRPGAAAHRQVRRHLGAALLGHRRDGQGRLGQDPALHGRARPRSPSDMVKVYSNFVWVLKPGEKPGVGGAALQGLLRHGPRLLAGVLPARRGRGAGRRRSARKVAALGGVRADRAEPARLGDWSSSSCSPARCCRGWPGPERGLTRSLHRALPGARVKRLEDPRLLRGGGPLPRRHRPARACCTPPSCAARTRTPCCRAVDAAAARALPGVAAVLDRPRSRRRGRPARAAARGAGLRADRLAGAGARRACASSASRWRWWSRSTPYAAADGRELVRVVYEPLPAVADVDAALAEARRACTPSTAATCSSSAATATATSTRAFAARGGRDSARRFTHGRCSASPLEPRGMIARWEGDAPHRLDGHADAARRPRRAGPRFGLARAPRARDRPRHRRRLRPEDARDARGPRRGRAGPSRRPARQVGRRRGAKTSPPPPRRARRAWRSRPPPTRGACCSGSARASCPTPAPYHIYPLTAALEPLGTAAILPGPYRTPAYAYESLAVATNKPPLGAYRGVGMTMGAFVMERDARPPRRAAAARSRRDPPAKPDPARRLPVHVRGGLRLRQRRFPEGARAGARPGRLRARSRASRTPRARHGRLLGVGLACYTEYTGMGARDLSPRAAWWTCRASRRRRVAMAADGSVACSRVLPVPGAGARDDDRPARRRPARRADRVACASCQPDTAAAPRRHRHLREPGRHRPGRHGGRVRRRPCARSSSRSRPRALEASAGGPRCSRDGRVTRARRARSRRAVAELARLAHSPPRGRTARGHASRASRRRRPSTRPGPTFSGAVHVASVEVDAETGRVAVRALRGRGGLRARRSTR